MIVYETIARLYVLRVNKLFRKNKVWCLRMENIMYFLYRIFFLFGMCFSFITIKSPNKTWDEEKKKTFQKEKKENLKGSIVAQMKQIRIRKTTQFCFIFFTQKGITCRQADFFYVNDQKWFFRGTTKISWKINDSLFSQW